MGINGVLVFPDYLINYSIKAAGFRLPSEISHGRDFYHGGNKWSPSANSFAYHRTHFLSVIQKMNSFILSLNSLKINCKEI